MPEQITNARLNLVAGEAFFEHFTGAADAVPEQFWLPADYGAIFGQLRGGAGSSRYAMPWRTSQRNRFWKAYCEQTPVSQVSAELANRLMVPLRLIAAAAPVVTLSDGDERIYYDVFGFPHGLVAALTIQSNTRSPLTVDQWRDRLRTLRLDPIFSVAVAGAPAETGLGCAAAVEAILRWHREHYFGAITAISPSETIFSIASVIQATGIDPSVALTYQPDLQRSLNAVTAWPINWSAATVPALDEAVLPVSSLNPSPGDALYAARRGRALWRPALFTYDSGATHRLHTLSCLAHNLLAGAVQAEALRLFAIRYAGLAPAEQNAIPAYLPQRAATLIGRLARGDQTYRSSSVQRQLEDSASLAAVNALLSAQQVPVIG